MLLCASHCFSPVWEENGQGADTGSLLGEEEGCCLYLPQALEVSGVGGRR